MRRSKHLGTVNVEESDQPLRGVLARAVDRWRMNRMPCKHNRGMLAYECEMCLVDLTLAALKGLRSVWRKA